METPHQKTPLHSGGKILEGTISRKSSNGFGSQSARSEDEVFADAVTYFVDSPSFGAASYGVMSRGNSLQNVVEFEPESSQLKEKNEDGDNLTSSTIPPSDKESPTVNARSLEGEFNEMKAMRSHDHISSSKYNLDNSGIEEHKVDVHTEDNSEGAFALGDVDVTGNETTEIKGVVEFFKSVHSIEDMVDPELGPTLPMVKQNNVGQEGQISDDKISDSNIIEFISEDVLEDIGKETGNEQEVSFCTEEKPVLSSDIFLSFKDEGGYDNDDQEMTVKENVNTNDDFKHEGNFGEVPDSELAVTSLTSAESFELAVDHGRDDDVGYVEKVNIHGTCSNENEVISGYSEKNDELFELVNEYDEGEVSKRLVQSKSGESTCGVEKCDERIDSVLNTSEDGDSLGPNSDVVTNRGVEREADNVPSVTEDDKITKKQSSVLVPDTGDSSSLTDSLDGNWGSISVLSAISDASPATDVSPSKNLQVLTEQVTVNSVPKLQEEDPQQCEDKTPVESQSHPPVAVEEPARTSDIHTQHNAQPAGGQHVVSHVGNDRVGGKKEKEIIAKVNDWDSGKQHTALKTLLGEAIAKSRAESPNHDDNSASLPKTETNDGISSVVSKDSETETCKEEIGKEWNSPARYPVNIKTEKKRGKSRPYWVPFLCCSSVNAR